MKNRIKHVFALLLAALLVLSLVGCSSPNDDPDKTELPIIDNVTVNVAVLNGTTGFGIAEMYEEYKNGKKENIPYETNKYVSFGADINFYADATAIVPLIVNGSVDVAAVPTNLAATLYKKTNGGIRVLAVNTLGVLYLVGSDGNVASLADLDGKTVYVPGLGTNPEYVFKTLLKKSGLEGKVTIDGESYPSPDALTSAVATGKVDLAVLPEPKITAAQMKNSELKVLIDFTKEWKNLTGTELVQGCLIARSEFAQNHPVELEYFLARYKKSVDYLNAEPKAAAELVVAAGIANSAALVENAIPRCHVTYLIGQEMKDALTQFWTALCEQEPSSVGGSVPDDKIFY